MDKRRKHDLLRLDPNVDLRGRKNRNRNVVEAESTTSPATASATGAADILRGMPQWKGT